MATSNSTRIYTCLTDVTLITWHKRHTARLFAAGLITNEEYGRKSDMRRRIVRAAGHKAVLDDATE